MSWLVWYLDISSMIKDHDFKKVYISIRVISSMKWMTKGLQRYYEEIMDGEMFFHACSKNIYYDKACGGYSCILVIR